MLKTGHEPAKIYRNYSMLGKADLRKTQQNLKNQTERITKQATMYLKKDPKTEKEIIL